MPRQAPSTASPKRRRRCSTARSKARSTCARTPNTTLPDLVAALHGQVDVELSGVTDTTKNGRLRNTFEMVPDVPVSTFTLTVRGGKRGLLVSTRNLCRHKLFARVEFNGQNGGRMLKKKLRVKTSLQEAQAQATATAGTRSEQIDEPASAGNGDSTMVRRTPLDSDRDMLPGSCRGGRRAGRHRRHHRAPEQPGDRDRRLAGRNLPSRTRMQRRIADDSGAVLHAGGGPPGVRLHPVHRQGHSTVVDGVRKPRSACSKTSGSTCRSGSASTPRRRRSARSRPSPKAPRSASARQVGESAITLSARRRRPAARGAARPRSPSTTSSPRRANRRSSASKRRRPERLPQIRRRLERRLPRGLHDRRRRHRRSGRSSRTGWTSTGWLATAPS